MIKVWRSPVFALLLVFSAMGPASTPQVMFGVASVIDGRQARLTLADRIERMTIRCEPREIDRYRRIVAVCFKGAEDLDRGGQSLISDVRQIMLLTRTSHV
jgi:hypothetical protein